MPADTASHEVPVCLRTPRLAQDADPLNEGSFPNLAVVACKDFAILSSAPVEKIFSVLLERYSNKNDAVSVTKPLRDFWQLNARMLPYKLSIIINDHRIYHNFVSFAYSEIKTFLIIQNEGNFCFIFSVCNVFFSICDLFIYILKQNVC